MAGTVYVFQASASLPTVSTITAPTGGTVTGLPGLANGTTSAQDFYLISSGSNGSTYDVLYVLSASSATAGTIAKYSLVSGSWTANGSYSTAFGGFGLCAARSGGGAALYVTTGTGATAANSVIQLADVAGYNSTINITTANNVTLYTGASGITIKGIAFAPISSVGLTPPTLVAAAGATVDGPVFNVTFAPDNPAWRGAITNISVNGTTLPTSAYSTIAAGQITFTNPASALLQHSGDLTITIGATGYAVDSLFPQNLGAGAPVKLGIITPLAAPSGNGGTLVTQPVVAVQDQYGNTVTSSTPTFTASVGTGAWTLGGATSQAAVAGVAAFTNLSATVNGASAVSGATIVFAATGLSAVTSAPFNILAPATAFTPGNLAVLQGDVAAGNNSTMTILELNPAIANQTSPVNAIPISATGANALRNSASASTTGRLADSDDGSLLAFAAFEDGSSATADETTILSRGVGTLDASGHPNVPASYTGLNGDQARGATSVDNNTWYISDKAGVYTNGLNAPANPTNVRSIRSFGHIVYVLSANTTVVSTVSLMGQLCPASEMARGPACRLMATRWIFI